MIKLGIAMMVAAVIILVSYLNYKYYMEGDYDNMFGITFIALFLGGFFITLVNITEGK